MMLDRLPGRISWRGATRDELEWFLSTSASLPWSVVAKLKADSLKRLRVLLDRDCMLAILVDLVSFEEFESATLVDEVDEKLSAWCLELDALKLTPSRPSQRRPAFAFLGAFGSEHLDLERSRLLSLLLLPGWAHVVP